MNDSKIAKIVNKQMVREFYSMSIKRVIGFYLTKAINEILGSLTVSSKGMRPEKLKLLKNEIMIQTLRTEKCKQILLFELDTLLLRKEEMIEELLKQYGIDTEDYSTEYHDEMTIIFSEVIRLYSSYVASQQYDLILKELDD